MAYSERALGNLLEEVQRLFQQQLKIETLLSLSKQLQAELKEHLISSPQCMLPSFNYTLPTGKEQGTYLALEVGGSNLRMALVELHGRSQGDDPMQIKRTLSFPIVNTVRQLQGYAFFDWMAQRIGDMLKVESGTSYSTEDSPPVRMGVAWSFPIEFVSFLALVEALLTIYSQKSIKSGNVLGMGKGFHCADAVKGQDLGEIISQACQRAVRLSPLIEAKRFMLTVV